MPPAPLPHPNGLVLTPDDRPLSVAVFCGSRFGNAPVYRDACTELGVGLAEAGLRLVYGGGRVGLMGVVADAVLEGGGAVLGIIPGFLQRREVAHGGPITLVVTDSMHDRKRQMFDAADAFVAMPGGMGTFDELIEITTWRQLALHDKPIFVCDVDGWAGPYVAAVEDAIARGFAPEATRALFEVVEDVPSLLAALQAVSPVATQDAGKL